MPPYLTEHDLVFHPHALAAMEKRGIPKPVVLAVVNHGYARFCYGRVKRTLNGYSVILDGNVVITCFEQGG
jgi:hypothetical protein